MTLISLMELTNRTPRRRLAERSGLGLGRRAEPAGIAVVAEHDRVHGERLGRILRLLYHIGDQVVLRRQIADRIGIGCK